MGVGKGELLVLRTASVIVGETGEPAQALGVFLDSPDSLLDNFETTMAW